MRESWYYKLTWKERYKMHKIRSEPLVCENKLYSSLYEFALTHNHEFFSYMNADVHKQPVIKNNQKYFAVRIKYSNTTFAPEYSWFLIKAKNNMSFVSAAKEAIKLSNLMHELI